MNKIKVENMTSLKGNKIANQFIIEGKEEYTKPVPDSETYLRGFEVFQSYSSVIAKKVYDGTGRIYIDKNKWDYSVTTGKYRNQFLNETKKETQAKIDSGEYILTDLN